MSNKTLSALIKSATKRLDQPCSQTDLLAVVKSFRDHQGPLEYSNTPAALFALFSALLTVPLIINISSGRMLSPEFTALMFGSATLGAVMLIGTLGFMIYRSAQIPDLTGSILERSALMRYGLQDIPLSKDQILHQLQRDFGDFDRGNYSREITYAVQGVYQGPLHALAYTYQTFKYVNQRIETTLVSDGKGGMRTQIRTVYDTFYRHCVVIDFPWVKNIKVQNDGQKEFKHRVDTAHKDFNRTFDANGANEVECVKFLKPTTILHLLEMAKHYGDLNLEFSHLGQLCMSFNNDDILEPFPNQLALSEPEPLYSALEAGIDLPKLTYTLQQIHTLAEQHDDNFAEPQKING